MARYCFQSQSVASGSEQTVTPRPRAIVSKIWSRSLRLRVTLLVLYLHHHTSRATERRRTFDSRFRLVASSRLYILTTSCT